LPVYDPLSCNLQVKIDDFCEIVTAQGTPPSLHLNALHLWKITGIPARLQRIIEQKDETKKCPYYCPFRSARWHS
jgi:hypothetical protein